MATYAARPGSRLQLNPLHAGTDLSHCDLQPASHAPPSSVMTGKAFPGPILAPMILAGRHGGLRAMNVRAPPARHSFTGARWTRVGGGLGALSRFLWYETLHMI